jgi:hypothetical protein
MYIFSSTQIHGCKWAPKYNVSRAFSEASSKHTFAVLIDKYTEIQNLIKLIIFFKHED